MERTLLLLRHGKSDWNAGARDDFARPLKRRGREAAVRIAGWLRTRGYLRPYIVSSGAARARSTAELVAAELGLPANMLHFDDRLYEANPETLLEICRHCQSQTRVLMLVGHNPGLELLSERLSNQVLAPASNGKLMPTAALAVLPLRRNWAELDTGAAVGAHIVRPRALTASAR